MKSEKCFFPGIKLPGTEADYSPSCNDEVKNEWNYIATTTCLIRLNRYSIIFSL